MILGCDVSVWQDDNSTAQMMNFEKAMNEGLRFAFIKASERMFKDLDFDKNWLNAKAAGMPRGAYHFLRGDISGLYQANFFCELLKDDPGELPPVADFEYPTKDGIYPSNALLWQFLETVESRLGIRPMVYTSPGYWNQHGKIKGTSNFDSKWAYFPLWIAHYTTAEKPIVPQPWTKWTFWQYTAQGDGLKYGAESKVLDLNRFNGDEMDWQKFLGEDVVDPGTPDPGIPEPPDPELEARITKLEMWAKGINYK